MANVFENLTYGDMEHAEDRLGGFSTLESDIYTATVKAAYATTSQSGALAVNLILDLDGREYRETVYVSNKEGKNYFMSKNNKKMPLPGFTLIDDLCLIGANKHLSEVDTEEKVLMIYSYEKQEEVKQNVPVITDLSGATVSIAILQELENKREKKGDKYVDTPETRETNRIVQVFNTETKQTVHEALKGEDAKFWDKWLEKNQGKVHDVRTIKNGYEGTAKAPAPAPAKRKSLFDK